MLAAMLRSTCARAVLDYAPRSTTLDALREALRWLVADGQVDVGGQPV